jgi:hypothetical protein
LHASKVLRAADFVINFGCFEVADSENSFSRFSSNISGLWKNKLYHVYLFGNAYLWTEYERNQNFEPGREISILHDFNWHLLLNLDLRLIFLRSIFIIYKFILFLW